MKDNLYRTFITNKKNYFPEGKSIVCPTKWRIPHEQIKPMRLTKWNLRKCLMSHLIAGEINQGGKKRAVNTYEKQALVGFFS